MSDPIQIRMGGYGPATTGFSRALKFIGDRLTAELGPRVEIKYVWNIMELGYRADDILWLVEHGLLTLGYQSSSYLTDRVPELGIVDLPFLFASTDAARAAMDGALGRVLAGKIEERVNFRILGWFENGFRHVSNRTRPVRMPADLKGLTIRVLPSKVQARTFELLGAVPMRMDLTQAIEMIKAGSIDAQENPLSNTVTYGVHKFHRFHTLSNHFYISRPIFLHRTAFDAWPDDLQRAMRSAVTDAKCRSGWRGCGSGEICARRRSPYSKAQFSWRLDAARPSMISIAWVRSMGIGTAPRTKVRACTLLRQHAGWSPFEVGRHAHGRVRLDTSEAVLEPAEDRSSRAPRSCRRARTSRPSQHRAASVLAEQERQVDDPRAAGTRSVR